MSKVRSKMIFIEGEPNPQNVKMWEQYKRAKLVAGRSEKTLKSYESDIMQFFRFLNSECFDVLLTEIDESHIEDYIGFCMEQGNNEKRIRRRISSVSSLLMYLKKKKKIKDNLQLETYINFGLCTMARSNAIAQITWDKIDFENRWVRDIVEKGGKVRSFRFDENVKGLLLKLKKQREDEGIDYPYVFFTKYNGAYGQVSSGSLSNWVKKAFSLIGIEGGYNHDLRHSMSNILKDRGMPITTISKLLGHSGVDVTINHYTIENLDKLAEEFDSFM